MSDKIKLTRDVIYGFTSSLLMSKFDNPKPTPQLHLEMWELLCSDEDRVAIAAPRGHAKSTAGTHCYVLANICFRIKDHILIISDTEGQATNFLGDIKAEFLENEELRSLFNIHKLAKDSTTEIIVEFTDGTRARILAKGSEQKVRGIKWRGKRPNLVVCDDLENDEIVMNEERRLKFRLWFYNALLQCGSSTCTYRVFGTILHLDSLLERIMPKLEGKDTVTTELSQSGRGQEDSSWRSVRYKAHNEDFSEILWSEQFSEERLKRIRQSYVEQGFPEGYSQEYLNYPLDTTNTYFRKKDFLELTKEDQPEEFYVSADLAISEKRSRAYTVLCVASVTKRGKLRFREVVRFRGDALEIIDELFRLQNIYKPEYFFIEEENIARSLGPVINKTMQERNTYLNIKTFPPNQDKIRRARSLQARMRAGMVEFDQDADWFPAFQQELLQFPRGAYMDQVDAAAWIALGLDNITDAPTKVDLLEEEYEKELEDTFYMNYEYGRNAITGY